MAFKNKIGLRIAKFIVEQTVSILLVQSCVFLIENPDTRAENQRGINCTDRSRNLVGWYAVSHRHSKKTCSGLMKTGLNNVLMPTLYNVVNSIEQSC